MMILMEVQDFSLVAVAGEITINAIMAACSVKKTVVKVASLIPLPPLIRASQEIRHLSYQMVYLVETL